MDEWGVKAGGSDGENMGEEEFGEWVGCGLCGVWESVGCGVSSCWW